MKNIHRQLLEHIQSGEPVVLATVVKTSGSTPQKPGSSALFCEKGLIAGTIGGGRLEGDVGQIAQHALISGTSGQYYFNLDSDSETAGAICGGEAEVLVDANPDLHKIALEEMAQALSKRIFGHICTMVSKEPGQDFSISRLWISGQEHSGMPGHVTPAQWQSIKASLAAITGNGFIETDLPSLSEGGKQHLFIESIKPMPHLVIAGAGHVGRALAHLASLLDFEITMIDDRQEFACMENIPDADHFIVKDIGLAMSEIDKGADTYIVIVTRDHKNDADALKPCIGSGAAYVGMIGSSHKVAILKKKFIEAGLSTEEQWAGVHTPIGIPIGSKTVQEIATSIAAQLVSERAKNQPGHA
jgi:xanthine dehydrogenase accessory factor